MEAARSGRKGIYLRLTSHTVDKSTQDPEGVVNGWVGGCPISATTHRDRVVPRGGVQLVQHVSQSQYITQTARNETLSPRRYTHLERGFLALRLPLRFVPPRVFGLPLGSQLLGIQPGFIISTRHPDRGRLNVERRQKRGDGAFRGNCSGRFGVCWCRCGGEGVDDYGRGDDILGIG